MENDTAVDKCAAVANGADKNELDACLEQQQQHHQETKRRRLGFGERLERRLRAKSGLSRRGLVVACGVVVLAFLLLVVVVALAAAWPTTPHAHSFPVCRTPSCLHASAQILSKMNLSQQPCSDFLKYSCDNWLQAGLPFDRSTWNQQEEVSYIYREHIRTLIVKMPYPTEITSVNWKIKHFYESCMDLENIETDKERPLRKMITEMKGWNILRAFSVYNWDYRHALLILHKQHGVSPFFKIEVVPDPTKPLQNIIKVSPAPLGLPHRTYYYRQRESVALTAYIRYIKDVTQLFGATHLDAQTFAEEIFYFERRIAEALGATTESRDPFVLHNRINIEKIKELAPTVPLVDILQGLFPQSAFDLNTEIIVTAPEYLKKISEIISTTDRGSLNNYFIWKFASEYLPFLSHEYRDVLNLYRKDMLGIQNSTERWEMCVATLERFMGFAIASLHDNSSGDKELNKKKVVEVNNMFNNIRNVIRERINSASWMNQELQKHTEEKVNAMVLQAGLSNALLSYQHMDEYYSRLQIHKNDFFQNVHNAVEFILSIQVQRLMSPTEEDRWLDAAVHGAEVSYIPSANKIVIPQRVMLAPFFNVLYPKSVLYGRLGIQIANAVVRGITQWDGLFSAAGTLLSPNSIVVNQTIQAVEWPKRMLITQIMLNEHVSESVANRTVLETLLHISAVKQARNALNAVENREPHIHQPALEDLESDQLFFVTYGQSLCTVTSPQQSDIFTTTSWILNNTQLIRTSLLQLPEFSAAFACGRDSIHYASNACSEIF